MDILNLKLLSNQIRFDIINMIYNARTGHPAGSLGLVELFVFLYFKKLKNNSSDNPRSLNRDFVFLSNGHVAPVLYATLARKGYFDVSSLNTLRKLSSKLQGHPHFGILNGVENSGGPLGQGISQAVGLASCLKRDKKKNKVYCFTGDGELAEGQCWEGFMYAAKENLDNLCVIVDKNNIQIDGLVSNVTDFKNLHKKFSSFGFYVIEFEGNNFSQIKSAFFHAEKVVGKPVCLLANNISGKGISFMESNYKWHGKAPNDKEYNIAISQLELEKEVLLKQKKLLGES